MAVGKPIIGAINCSCSNFIINDKVGYTCPSNDSEALANLIKKLDKEELIKIGNTAKEVYYKKYSKEHFINKLIDELNKLI